MIPIVKCRNDKAFLGLTSLSGFKQQVVRKVFCIFICPRAAVDVEENSRVLSLLWS